MSWQGTHYQSWFQCDEGRCHWRWTLTTTFEPRGVVAAKVMVAAIGDHGNALHVGAGASASA